MGKGRKSTDLSLKGKFSFLTNSLVAVAEELAFLASGSMAAIPMFMIASPFWNKDVVNIGHKTKCNRVTWESTGNFIQKPGHPKMQSLIFTDRCFLASGMALNLVSFQFSKMSIPPNILPTVSLLGPVSANPRKSLVFSFLGVQEAGKKVV